MSLPLPRPRPPGHVHVLLASSTSSWPPCSLSRLGPSLRTPRRPPHEGRKLGGGMSHGIHSTRKTHWEAGCPSGGVRTVSSGRPLKSGDASCPYNLVGHARALAAPGSGLTCVSYGCGWAPVSGRGGREGEAVQGQVGPHCSRGCCAQRIHSVLLCHWDLHPRSVTAKPCWLRGESSASTGPAACPE